MSVTVANVEKFQRDAASVWVGEAVQLGEVVTNVSVKRSPNEEATATIWSTGPVATYVPYLIQADNLCQGGIDLLSNHKLSGLSNGHLLILVEQPRTEEVIVLSFYYTDTLGNTTWRTAGLISITVDEHPDGPLYHCWCHLRKDFRNFRKNRMRILNAVVEVGVPDWM